MQLVALRKWCFQNNTPFLSIYLYVDADKLLTRLKNRSDANELPEARLAEDAYYEVFKKWSDIIYDYNNKTVQEAVEDIMMIMKEAGIIV
ncbi:MAG: hypothetical protein WCK88_07740 [bacterium]